MTKRNLGILLALALVMIAGVFTVSAQPMPTPTPEPVIRPSFTDGRINAYDPGAPVAVFETRQSVPIVNDNGVPTTADVVNGVQLLYWDGASAKEVLNVSAADIKAAIDKFTNKTSTLANTPTNNSTVIGTINSSVATGTPAATTNANSSTKNTTFTTTANGNSIVISKVNGYTLNYSKDGYLWITTPPDFEGKVYTFSWHKDF